MLYTLKLESLVAKYTLVIFLRVAMRCFNIPWVRVGLVVLL